MPDRSNVVSIHKYPRSEDFENWENKVVCPTEVTSFKGFKNKRCRSRCKHIRHRMSETEFVVFCSVTLFSFVLFGFLVHAAVLASGKVAEIVLYFLWLMVIASTIATWSMISYIRVVGLKETTHHRTCYFQQKLSSRQ